MTTATLTRPILVMPIAVDVLDALRERDADEFGNALQPYDATGGEPLRCCLRRAEIDEVIALISYSPHVRPSPWAEVGPVYVHVDGCRGPARRDVVPAALNDGPRVLRAYRADGSMNYDANVLLEDGLDVAAALDQLLRRPDVAEVHVRTAVPQCFLYAVRHA